MSPRTCSGCGGVRFHTVQSDAERPGLQATCRRCGLVNHFEGRVTFRPLAPPPPVTVLVPRGVAHEAPARRSCPAIPGAVVVHSVLRDVSDYDLTISERLRMLVHVWARELRRGWHRNRWRRRRIVRRLADAKPYRSPWIDSPPNTRQWISGALVDVPQASALRSPPTLAVRLSYQREVPSEPSGSHDWHVVNGELRPGLGPDV